MSAGTRPGLRGAMTRRDLLRGLLASGLGAAALGGVRPRSLLAQAGQAPLPGAGEEGSLRDPSAVGRSATPTSRYDDDPRIKTIEQRIACRCGCTLDVFTCRTTDFTCTYSPAMHREVVDLYTQGKSGQQIVDAFVAEYGEKVLMAPKPQGFNLAGYLVPGAAITVVGAVLAWVIRRRAGGRGDGSLEVDAPTTSRPAPRPSPVELARLQQALREIED